MQLGRECRPLILLVALSDGQHFLDLVIRQARATHLPPSHLLLLEYCSAGYANLTALTEPVPFGLSFAIPEHQGRCSELLRALPLSALEFLDGSAHHPLLMTLLANLTCPRQEPAEVALPEASPVQICLPDEEAARRQPPVSPEQKSLVLASGLWDEAWYRHRHPDVVAARVDPLEHYLTFGFRENRDPGPLFSNHSYYRAYPDVALAGMNPLLHYVLHGQQEARSIWRSEL